MTWFLYIVECKDRTLYTGISTDISRRIAEHVSGKGSKYLRSRSPLKLVHSEVFRTRGRALKREAEIKRWTRSMKQALIRTGSPAEYASSSEK